MPGQFDGFSRRAILSLLLACIALYSSAQLTHASTAVSEQRELFQQAQQALREGNNTLFSSITDQLKDYPVVAYLHYDELNNRLGKAGIDEVQQFLQAHQDYPFHYHLLSKWLKILAKRNDWENYLAFYDGRSATRFKCLAITAKLETGETAKINQQIKPIWMSGYSQPDECDTPFKHFLDTAEDKETLIWSRIEKAFKARRSALARYLGKKLDSKGQALVEDWYQAHRHPEKWLNRSAAIKDDTLNRKIVVHAIDRLARKNSPKARKHWEKLEFDYGFSDAQRQQIQKRLALSAAYQHKSEAKQLLEDLPNTIKNDNAHLWLARIHLRDEDWIGLIKTIIAMPDHLSKEAEWSYWLARAYGEAGHDAKAQSLYKKLSTRSSYYGFLAADRARVNYRINQQAVTGTDTFDEESLLQDNLHLLRARELFFLDRLIEARREWFQGIRKLKANEIKQAAQMASGWKWHENAIKTVAKTSHRSDYDLRFPMPYQPLVMDNIRQHDLDPAVIYGVMRRESLFDPLAKSRAGALGLMQLMPYTARSVARSLGLKKPRQADILNVKNNIRLGTRYFKTVLNRFDNNVSLAAAAYNAGPKNVKKWLPEQEPLSADLWVETVPFKETRNYVQAVLAYATIFDKHLGQDVLISSRMADVKATY